MFHDLHRLRAAFRIALSSILLSVFCETAAATTTVSGTITTNTTWTLVGSPYVVQTFVWVNPGVTLTIEPGVIVKMAGGSGSFIQVRGNLVAIGTAANRITFTSIQDDSIGGDTGGDGSTAGAPGQWSSIAARSLGTLTFTYVDVRFGGWGTSLTAYSALLAYNGGSALLDHVRAQFNANSGLLVTGGATANVAHSVFSDNAVGISIGGASAQIHSNSSLTNNSDTGLYIGLISTFTGAATSVMNSEISGNLGWGVYLLIYPDVSQLRYGHQNNIRNNGVLTTDQRQLFSSYALAQSLWTNNYWGEILSEPSCDWAPPTTTRKHLSFDPFVTYCLAPGRGPVPYSQWTASGGCPDNKPRVCAADHVTNSPHSQTPFDNSGF